MKHLYDHLYSSNLTANRVAGLTVDLGASRQRARARGFTLVELVMTIVLVSVLAATAVPRLRDLGSIDARGFRDETLAAVRYARRLAIATGCDVQVIVDAGGYAVSSRGASCDSGAFASPVDHPSRPGAFTGAAPTGVGVGAALVRFDRIGRPRDGADAALGAALGITIGPHTIIVEPETGYVRAP